MLQVRRGKRDNLEIIFHITPLKHMLLSLRNKKKIFEISSISLLIWSSDVGDSLTDYVVSIKFVALGNSSTCFHVHGDKKLWFTTSYIFSGTEVCRFLLFLSYSSLQHLFSLVLKFVHLC